MRFRAGVAAVILIAVVGVLAPAAAPATETADQQQLTWTGGTYSPTLAQTFTAGATGELTRVRLYLKRAPDTPTSPAAVVEIRAVESGAPTGTATAGTGTVLATELLDVAAVSTDAWTTPTGSAIDVAFDEPAAIVAGQSYAIVLVQTGTAMFWFQYAESGTTGPYAGGQRWSAPAGAPLSAVPISDAMFETFVSGSSAPDLLALATAVGDAADLVPASGWSSPGAATAFGNRTDTIVAAVQAGDLDDARQRAENLRRTVDGCGAQADTTDWIRTCTAQLEVRAQLDALLDALTP